MGGTLVTGSHYYSCELDIYVQDFQDPELLDYFETVSAGASALPFMKASYSLTYRAPLVGLPPEMMERVCMYCTMGRLSISEVRRLYPTGVLLGAEGITDREITHFAIDEKNDHSFRVPSKKIAIKEKGCLLFTSEKIRRVIDDEKEEESSLV